MEQDNKTSESIDFDIQLTEKHKMYVLEWSSLDLYPKGCCGRTWKEQVMLKNLPTSIIKAECNILVFAWFLFMIMFIGTVTSFC